MAKLGLIASILATLVSLSYAPSVEAQQAWIRDAFKNHPRSLARPAIPGRTSFRSRPADRTVIHHAHVAPAYVMTPRKVVVRIPGHTEFSGKGHQVGGNSWCRSNPGWPKC